jgi:integrase
MRGSVFKRCPCGTTGTPGKPACRKPHGSWSWRSEGETGPDGNRKQPSESGFRTRDDAQEALNKHLAARQAGTWVDDQKTTVETWLTTWLEECTQRLEPKTVAGYRGHVEGVLIPQLGKHRLRALRRHHVEAMVQELQTPGEPPERAQRPKVRCGEPREDGEPCTRWAVAGGVHCPRHGGVSAPTPGPGRGGRVVEKRSARTLDSYRRTLRAALAAAVRRGLVAQNVAEGRIDALPAVRRSVTTWWEPAEVASFLEAVALNRLAAMYEIAAFAGLRRAELLGLRWEDVDLTSAQPGLNVAQTLSGLAGTHPCFVCGGQHTGRRLKPPKTDAGTRWVPLIGGTVRELIAHQAAQSSERQAWGDAYDDHGLVFAQEDGVPLRPDWVTKQFETLSAKRGLPRIRLHDMRHGAASLLLAAGVPIEMVGMILGHASPAVTRQVYAHVLKGPAAAGMKAAAALVRPEPRAQSVHRPGQSAPGIVGEEG